MGGLPCRKEIIDQIESLEQRVDTKLAALNRSLGCMRASILLAGATDGSGISPTDKHVADFMAATNTLADELDINADELATLAAVIQAHVSGDTGG